MRTRDKVTTALMCFVLVTIYLLLFSFYINHVRESNQAEINERLIEVSKHTAEVTSLQAGSDAYTLTAIANLIATNGYKDPETYLSYLKNEVKLNEFKTMGIIEPGKAAYLYDGTVVDASDFTNTEYLDISDGKAKFSNAILDAADGKRVVVICVPIIQDGEVVAGIFAANSIEVIQQRISLETYNGRGSSFVISQDGSPLVLSKMFEEDEYFENLFTFIWGNKATSPDNTTAQAFYADIEAGKCGSFLYDGPFGKRYLSYYPVGMNGWYACTSVDQNLTELKTDATVKFTLLLEGATILLIIIFMMYIFMQKTRNHKELKVLAFIDKITGFGNWNKLKEDMKHLFKENPMQEYAMVILDVDDFKVVNDLYGHHRGNEILTAIASGVNGFVEPDETFGRNTADHFNVLLKFSSAEKIVERVEELNRIILSNPICCRIKLSYGIYIIDDTSLSASVISDRAQLAKKSVKGRIDLNYAFYDGQVRDQLLLDREIETEMENALATGQFHMFLQPKILINGEKLSGAEALVRWKHPIKGIIPPFMFIPLFERNGFITKIDMYMFEQVCLLLKNFHTKCSEVCNGDFTVSVNLSRIHLNNPYLVDDLCLIARKYDVSPSCIEIELTESAIFENIDSLVTIMNELKEKGFMISIDDFGSGYSSLNLLKDIPTDILKIDKEFLSEASDSGRGRKIISSIVQMANELGIQTVAEGVETKEQVDFLVDIGCDIAQGYYFAKPMPIEDFIDKVEYYEKAVRSSYYEKNQNNSC